MKFVHVSDLHIGKRVNEYSMLEDQRHALKQIIEILDRTRPDALVIAGDVYDKTTPSAEAVEVFDDFLFEVSNRQTKCFIISGNHDSAERLAFCNRLIDKSGIYISSVYGGTVSPVNLTDEYGTVSFYMLPFIKPQNVRKFFGEDITTYTQAVAACIEQMNIDKNSRNVLITHQFVAGAERTESEEISVGGSDSVDASVFSAFDYVALGHIHRSQSVSSENIRYSGTPLKYSFSESKDEKSATIVEMKGKGDISVSFEKILPLRDMVEIRGSYAELTDKAFYENTTLRDDYVRITLTDEEEILDVAAKLRVVYRNFMKLSYDNARTRNYAVIESVDRVEKKSPMELFEELFRLQNGVELTAEQRKITEDLIGSLWGTKDETE